MREVAGKVAVVTGGGQGIGRALIERFTGEGMKAVLADVSELVARTTAELRADGRDVTGVVTDVTSLESVEALRDATLDAYGAVHVVCNNAGIGSGSEGQIWEQPRQRLAVVARRQRDGRRERDQRVRPDDARAGRRGPCRQHDVGQRRFTPLINSAVYATTKAAVATITECLWGQLRDIGAKVSAYLLYRRPAPRDAQHGHLAAGREPPRPLRPARRTTEEGRDTLGEYLSRMEAAGLPVEFAPLRKSPTSASRASSTTRSGSPSRTSCSRRRSGREPESQVARSAPELPARRRTS